MATARAGEYSDKPDLSVPKVKEKINQPITVKSEILLNSLDTACSGNK